MAATYPDRWHACLHTPAEGRRVQPIEFNLLSSSVLPGWRLPLREIFEGL
ncbi:MAG: hypothetical protein ACRD8O_14015 [Bryobacteraceae bacterium]